MVHPRAPQTGLWEDVLLVMVAARAAVDLLASSGSPARTIAVALLAVVMALFIGLRVRLISGTLRSLLAAAALGGWLLVTLPRERPDLIPMFLVLAIAMLLAYAITDLWRFGVRVSLAQIVFLLLVGLVLVGSCSQLVGSGPTSSAP
jgi:hypothetical protein